MLKFKLLKTATFHEKSVIFGPKSVTFRKVENRRLEARTVTFSEKIYVMLLYNKIYLSVCNSRNLCKFAALKNRLYTNK